MGETSSALKTLVGICAIFENSMFLLDYKNEYLFGELNEKNRYAKLKYIIKPRSPFFTLCIIYDGELGESVIIMLIVNNKSFRCNVRFLK